ncbi:MAG: AtpZ/AtpI family protein [Planctomycetota bacterium]
MDEREHDGAPQPDPAPADRPGYRPSGAPEIPDILRDPADRATDNSKAPAGEAPRTRGVTGLLGHGFARQFSPKRASSPELKAIGIAFQLFAMFGAGLLLGWGADTLFGSKPIGILTGACVGLVTGMYHSIRDGLKLSRELERIEEQRRRGR